jgi:DNA repair protein RecO (recombination protein O)
MEFFQDDAIILHSQVLQEHDLLLDLLCKSHGKIRAVAKFGATSKKRALYQPLNQIQIQAKSRTNAQIVKIEAELLTPYFSLVMNNRLSTLILQTANELCRNFLPEKEKNIAIYHDLMNLYFCSTSESAQSLLISYAFFELKLLQYCGYGLQLNQCVATGNVENLRYISPKTGGAVCYEAGKPYHDRLFLMPNFYVNQVIPSNLEITQALEINHYFIKKFLCEEQNKKPPAIRERLIKILQLVEC